MGLAKMASPWALTTAPTSTLLVPPSHSMMPLPYDPATTFSTIIVPLAPTLPSYKLNSFAETVPSTLAIPTDVTGFPQINTPSYPTPTLKAGPIAGIVIAGVFGTLITLAIIIQFYRLQKGRVVPRITVDGAQGSSLNREGSHRTVGDIIGLGVAGDHHTRGSMGTSMGGGTSSMHSGGA
ncbi:hypothetical protein GGR54DRAFT_403770 [Hypoxylon sp. NC1633]|nr:hypothetical protein GGR54DRAFT_403770 [Hypoxylon sp. NC1633]